MFEDLLKNNIINKIYVDLDEKIEFEEFKSEIINSKELRENIYYRLGGYNNLEINFNDFENRIFNAYEFLKFNSYKKLWDKLALNQDSSFKVDLFYQTDNFKNFESFKVFIDKNKLTNVEIDEKNHEIEIKSFVKNNNENITKLKQNITYYDISFYIVIILFFLIFPLRYLIIFIKFIYENHKKYVLLSFLIFLIIMILTNPSMKNCKEFIPEDENYGIWSRNKNFIIFSIYEYKCYNKSNYPKYYEKKYFGIFKNFIEIK